MSGGYYIKTLTFFQIEENVKREQNVLPAMRLIA